MPEQYEISDAIRHIHLIVYLLSQADDRGKTHGEKHHIHEVIGMELKTVCKLLHCDGYAVSRNIDDSTPTDIPF